MGPCAGGAVYSPAITDFTLMVEGTSYMFITGPDVVRTVTGEEVSFEELGGAATHATKSGVAHFAAENEQAAIVMTRELLSFLPSNNQEDPPVQPCDDDPFRAEALLKDIVPSNPNKPYDIKEVIKAVVDNKHFFEVQEQYAKNIVVGFARMNGRSVGIVALVSGLVGVILAYMGAVQLQRVGAQSYMADLVTIGVVREVGALMTGVILSGRVGAAYAAQLGSMQANEEVDALRALGIDPIDHLVLPRMLALLLMAPLLTAFAAVTAILCGGLVALVVFGVPPMEYLYKSSQALTLPHVWIGLSKGTVYCVLVALAGCRQGLNAGRSAQAVGAAVTSSVVQAIVWIVVAASAMTIAFQRLDW